MKTTTVTPIENLAEEAKQRFHQVVDFLYGTPARTNRTLLVLVAAVASAKLMEMMVVVPYCPV